jgi:hypothetical protein
MQYFESYVCKEHYVAHNSLSIVYATACTKITNSWYLLAQLYALLPSTRVLGTEILCLHCGPHYEQWHS